MNTTALSLLERLRSPFDNQAWEQFVRLYSPMLLSWATKAGLERGEAADLAQEVLLVLLRLLPVFHYDSAKGTFRGLLKTITIRKCREWQRRKSPWLLDPTALQAQQDEESLEALWEEEHRQSLARRALLLMQNQFEPNTWRACWETTARDRAAKDVAAELGMSVAAVFVAKSRVLKRLRLELGE